MFKFKKLTETGPVYLCLKSGIDTDFSFLKTFAQLPHETRTQARPREKSMHFSIEDGETEGNKTLYFF